MNSTVLDGMKEVNEPCVDEKHTHMYTWRKSEL